MTEAEFLALLGEEHPAALALEGEFRAAEARRQQAGLALNPELEWQREEPDGEARETTWAITWTPPLDGRRRGAVEVASAGLEAERYRLEALRLRQRLEAKKVYAEWAIGQAVVESLAGHARQLERLEVWMRNRAASGEESELAAWRVGAAAQLSKNALADGRADEIRARSRASAWDGGGFAGDRTVVPQLTDPALFSEAEPWSRHPMLEEGLARVAEAEAHQKRSRRVLGAPALRFGWKTLEESRGELEGPVFGLGWRAPLFDRGQAERAAAEAALQTARAREEWMRRQLGAQWEAALASYKELFAVAATVSAENERWDRITAAAIAAFEGGETTVTDLLATLEELLDVRLGALELHAKALAAWRDVELAAGQQLTSGGVS